MMELKSAIVERARSLGFDRIGFARAEALPGGVLQQRLAMDYYSGLGWMAERLEMRLDPRRLLPGARTVIVAAITYYAAEEPPEAPHLARVSRYAWGEDYHRVIRKRLKALLAFVRECAPGVQGRLCVDAAPIMEKEWARRAGIGWVGKHSLVLAPGLGSWIFLGEIVTDLEVEPDQPVAERCGACTLCLEACPTGALVAPYTLDTQRCLACLTIETEVDLPEEVRRALGNRVFGCDICQSVCPWNRKWAVPAADPVFQPRPLWLSAGLEELAAWSPEQFAAAAKGSPLQRRSYAGFMRMVRAAQANCK
ncbi:MAG TPA: tRNA epoxyqueuosine(34) reductase QueG [bacterium]|nr:tRNA epoxyqueuosine(34) reductase QueG [bacterium]